MKTAHRGCDTVWLLMLVVCGSWGDVRHLDNVALGKPCGVSSTYFPSTLPCGNAINGNIDGNTWPALTNCIHTGSNDLNPWWYVDLGQSYPIRQLVIWSRTQNGSTPNYANASVFQKRMSRCVVSVDGVQRYAFGDVPGDRNVTIIDFPETVIGRVLSLNKSSTSFTPVDDNTINMCEFQVFVCSAGYWGNDCDIKCGNCSNGQPCDRRTGTCPTGSSSGLVPPLCNPASDAVAIAGAGAVWISLATVVVAVTVIA